MAGKSHWSASVELDPDNGRVTFDVACRVRGGGAVLESRYRLLARPLEQAGGHAILACGDAVRSRLSVDSELGSTRIGVRGRLLARAAHGGGRERRTRNNPLAISGGKNGDERMNVPVAPLVRGV